MADTQVRGLDTTAVSAWPAAELPGATAPFEFELITAGGSNLTYRVVDAADRVVAPWRASPAAATIGSTTSFSAPT